MKKYLSLVLALVLAILLIPAASALSDQGAVLSESQQQRLEQKLSALSAEHGVRVEVVTVSTYSGYDVWSEARSYCNRNFPGEDMVLLYIAVEDREWALVGYGDGSFAFNTAAEDYLEAEILPLMEEDRFSEAFTRYAEVCDEVLTGYYNGTPYEAPTPWGTLVVIALGIGLVAGLITVLILRGQLKSVRRQAGATAYTRPGSMAVTLQTDTFLYSNVSRTPRPKNNSSGGSRSRSGGGFSGRSGRF